MQPSTRETGYLNVREVMSAAARQREMYLASTLKDSSAARAGPAVLALLLVACAASVAVDGGMDARSPAQAQITVALAAPPEAATSLPADHSNPGGDGNVPTYERD